MLVPLVDDAEPWERTAGRVPYGRIADSLDVEFEELRELMGESDEESA